MTQIIIFYSILSVSGCDDINSMKNVYSAHIRIERGAYYSRNAYYGKYSTMKPLLWGLPFYARNMVFQEGWPHISDRNQYIHA